MEDSFNPTSYTYEATFGAGSIGINLQTTRTGFGSYVDSFRPGEGGTQLPAEMSGYIKLGDVLVEVNKEDVSQMPLEDIPRVLERAKRPITIKFERRITTLNFSDVARDPRKLPWFMQFLVETQGIEEAAADQAKLMLWLECDQFVQNFSILSDKDVFDHAMQIFKKFFREGSGFSVLDSLTEKLKRRAISLTKIISAVDGISKSENNLEFLRLFRECVSWIDSVLSESSFHAFRASSSSTRMMGHLMYSPEFEKMTLMDILGDDKRTMFMLAFLCQTKRHITLYCYNILNDESLVESAVATLASFRLEDLTGLIKKAYVCIHMLGVQESQQGAEDLPMVIRLKQLVQLSDATTVFKLNDADIDIWTVSIML